MSITLLCSRCGKPLPPPEDTDLMKMMLSTGASVTHDVCPDDAAAAAPAPDPGRYFELRVQVVEIKPSGGTLHTDGGPVEQVVPVRLAEFTVGANAPTLDAATRPLAAAFGEKYTEFEKHARIADTPVVQP